MNVTTCIRVLLHCVGFVADHFLPMIFNLGSLCWVAVAVILTVNCSVWLDSNISVHVCLCAHHPLFENILNVLIISEPFIINSHSLRGIFR